MNTEKKVYYLVGLIILLLFNGCQRYYWRKFVPEKTYTMKVNGWDVKIKVYVRDGGPVKVTSSDTLYWISLYLRRPSEWNKMDSVYLKTEFEIESAYIRFVDTGLERKIYPKFELCYNWRSGKWLERLYDLGSIFIPQGIQRIQFDFVILIKQRDDDIGGQKRNFVINMCRYESAKWLPYLPMFK